MNRKCWLIVALSTCLLCCKKEPGSSGIDFTVRGRLLVNPCDSPRSGVAGVRLTVLSGGLLIGTGTTNSQGYYFINCENFPTTGVAELYNGGTRYGTPAGFTPADGGDYNWGDVYYTRVKGNSVFFRFVDPAYSKADSFYSGISPTNYYGYGLTPGGTRISVANTFVDIGVGFADTAGAAQAPVYWGRTKKEMDSAFYLDNSGNGPSIPYNRINTRVQLCNYLPLDSVTL
jgi:hypothetical protein